MQDRHLVDSGGDPTSFWSWSQDSATRPPRPHMIYRRYTFGGAKYRSNESLVTKLRFCHQAAPTPSVIYKIDIWCSRVVSLRAFGHDTQILPPGHRGTIWYIVSQLPQENLL
ncbi:hypothetical protein AVEN_109625-1 [Araneus ventricosus]|uniref:Uncharacterized protein n=1 Tax=Araneus ventricosus TaxID=182803 RepID=A0A4Y2FRJ7_ARAVE|nr:hypothetical protein AVEN_109625-1 [Araneus ventricosus]